MDMNSNILLGEKEVFTTHDADVKDGIINYRAGHDRYFQTKIEDMFLYVRRSGETCDEFRARTNSRLCDAEIDAANLFLKVMCDLGDGTLRRGLMPVRDIAFRSILERARLAGFTFTNEEDQADCTAMTLEEKADFINKCFKLYSGYAKVLYRDRKVTSVMSQQYYPIGIDVLDSALQEGLKEDYDNIEFDHLNISQEFFSERYLINDEEVEEDITLMLSDAGMPANNVKVCVDAYTGDHGNIAATYIARLKVDDTYVAFGKPVSIKHSGKKSKESLVKASKKLYKMFRNSEKALRSLMTIKVDHPDGCIRLLAKEFHLPKKETMEVAESYELRTDVTGYEIYFALNDIVRRVNSGDFQKMITLQEAVAETLTADYKKYDKVFLWARRTKAEMDAADDEDELDLDDNISDDSNDAAA